jgi:hypothetical protein
MQTSLFDLPVVIAPCDPSVHPDEKPRLSKQCQAILDLLRQRPATNDELSRMARKYTSRISDLRAAGYVISVIEHNHKTGVTRYRLEA